MNVVLDAGLGDPSDHPRGRTIGIDPAPLRVLGLGVLVVTAVAVVVAGAIPILVAEGKRVRQVADEDLAGLLADDRLLKASSRPPRAGNIALVGDRIRDVIHRAGERSLVSLAGADLVTGVDREGEVVRPVDDVRCNLESLSNLELLGRPGALDCDRGGHLGAA